MMVALHTYNISILAHSLLIDSIVS